MHNAHFDWCILNFYCQISHGVEDNFHKMKDSETLLIFIQFGFKAKTLPKAQQTRGLSDLFRSFHKSKHKSWSNFIFRISTKHQLQNLKQTSASRLYLKFKTLTKPSFRILTKIKLHNLNQASAAKYWPKFSFKISPKL